MFKRFRKKQRPAETVEESEASATDPWDGDPVSEASDFRGDYAGEGVWYECGNCDAVHEIDESASYRGLIEDLCTSVSASSREIYEQFNLGSGGRWDTLPDHGLFKFTTGDGRVCTAPYGVVGSWNDRSHSWLWTWAMPDDWLHPPVRTVCERLKARADQEGDWEPVMHGTLFVNEHEAWHLTNLAAWVNDMPMVYRAKVNEMNWHYFALGKPTWVN